MESTSDTEKQRCDDKKPVADKRKEIKEKLKIYLLETKAV